MPPKAEIYEKLGAFYLGRRWDLEAGEPREDLTLYDSKDLTTHAMCVGMTGSGKTGLCVCMLEEAAIDGVPAIVIDPKGDLANLALTFPDLAPADFRPWVDEDAARRKGLSVDEFAAQQAELWRSGLADWGQNGERIRRLRESAELTIYTPGSDAGLPVSVLASFAAPPPEVRDDRDLLSDRVTATAASLLGLLGVDADPVQSREHILLSTLLDRAWRAGEDLDLGRLIQQVQEPPVEKVGVMPLESFFPSKDRFALAMKLNNLLAAPGFASWLEGEPLDVDRLLYTAEGKPRLAIFSIAHLGDAERMFFVSLLLNQVVGWMRSRPGTASLRALVYMDEVFGYLPPVAEPPSKRPMLTLLKQARAFGVGVVLATQNPVDLDYKALSNVGTWFLGRLQTERDKARVMEGLEGVAAGGAAGFDRDAMEKTLAGLGKRVFLLHNVHEDGPEVFHTRWALSYLRGPLTRLQIARLVKGRQSAGASDDDAGAAAGAAVADVDAAQGAGSGGDRPVLPPKVPEAFLPVAAGARGGAGAGAGTGVAYRARLAGVARVHFVDAKRSIEHREELTLLAVPAEEVDWSDGAAELDLDPDRFEDSPEEPATFGPLPAAAADPGSYRRWEKELSDALYRGRRLAVFECAAVGAVSRPDESERDFRMRISDEVRAARDREVEELRGKYASRIATLTDRIRRAEQKVDKERDQARSAKMGTLVNVGTAIFGALLGRKKLSSRNLSRAGSAVRGVGRSLEQGQDVDRAEDSLEAAREKLADLEKQVEAEVEDLASRLDPTAIELTTRTVKPRRVDVEVRTVTLAWAPFREGPAGVVPAWPSTSRES